MPGDKVDVRRLAIKRLDELGFALQRKPHKPNEQRYVLPDGTSVRLLTSKVGTMLCTTDGISPEARLSISGTDLVAFASMSSRGRSDAIAIYLIPTSVVEMAFREDHRRWLESNPRTKGRNLTWQIKFNEAVERISEGYAQKWSQYRLT